MSQPPQNRSYGPYDSRQPEYGTAPPSRVPIAAIVAVVVLTVLLGAGLTAWFTGWGDPGPTTGPTTSPSPTADPTQDPTTSEPTSEPTTDPTDPPSSEGTEQASTATGEIDADGRFSGPGYSFAAPAGWEIAADSGTSDDGRIEDGQGTDITVWIIRAGMTACLNDADALKLFVPGDVAPLPERDIGGVTASGNSLTGDDGSYYEMYCADVDGVVYEASIETTTAAAAGVLPLWEDALDSWQWG